MQTAFTGSPINFKTEKAYTDWLLSNIDVLKAVLGVTGDGTPRVNQPLHADTGYRPDIVFRCEDRNIIIEIKNTRSNWPHANNVGSQIKATAELEYYGLLCKSAVLVLVAPTITHEIIDFIRHYGKKIWLIEANPTAFTVIPATDG
jgi:hypothetical protein